MNPSPDESKMTEKTPQNRYSWTFILSLALNFLLIGVIVGAIWTNKKPNPMRKVKHFIMTLPTEQREDIRDIFKKSRRNVKNHRKTLRKAKREAADILSAEEFTRVAFENALMKLRNSRVSLISERHKMITDIASKLTPDQRQTFKKIFTRHRRKRRH